MNGYNLLGFYYKTIEPDNKVNVSTLSFIILTI